MYKNVEHSTKPDRFIYEQANGMAHITLSDNIREGVNANGEDCWYCDLYMMVLPDHEQMAQRLEKSFGLFLAKAKADEVERKRKEQDKPAEPNERIDALEEQNAMLMECLLEMSEAVYA